MKNKGVVLVLLLFFSTCTFAAESGNAEQATKHNGRLPAQEKEASFSAPVSEGGADSRFGTIDLGGGLGVSSAATACKMSPGA